MIASNQLAGWIDQAIVSATNFLIIVVLARWAGVADVGYYAIAFTILAVAVASQDSLVTKPYAVQLFKPPGSPEAHAYGARNFAFLNSIALSLILCVIAFALYVFGAERQMTVLVLCLALVVPFILFREFARRYSFANMLMHQALALDVAVSIILFVVVAALALSNELSATSCLAALGFSCALASGIWFIVKRHAFARKPSITNQIIRQSWAIGKWLLFGQMSRQAQGYAAHWITLLIGGAVATGIYSAYVSIVALANPFLFGLFNVLTPKFVRTLNEHGPTALRRQASIDTLIIVAIMGSFALMLALFGQLLMAVIFPGEEYARNTNVLTILALAQVLSAMGGPAIIGLTACEKTRAVAGVALITALLGSGLVWILMSAGGLLGAAYGIFITEGFLAALSWVIFIRATSVAEVNLPEDLALSSASPSPSTS